ncbi:ATPase [Bacteroidales bacterium OttesenSCG-928-M06]|nr:ATPase [Bacteroidales bacterium OttesenSCG-928-M06]
MFLIADSGSTKTNWSICLSDTSVQLCTTSGINPFFMTQEDIVSLLEEEFVLKTDFISSICFYGAGCTPEKTPVVSEALQKYFKVDHIMVYSDLLAAVHSLCQRKEGIVGILGTGSNSCYYDGMEIVRQVSPLGYILGDEGSGAFMGKKLVADILKNQMPDLIIRAFIEKYQMTQANIIENVYRQPFPNRFLAQFTPFIKEWINEESISVLVDDCLSEFVKRNLLQYPKVTSLPVHFTGSIAYHFKENIEKVMKKYHLHLGEVVQDPMPGLIQYHCHG